MQYKLLDLSMQIYDCHETFWPTLIDHRAHRAGIRCLVVDLSDSSTCRLPINKLNLTLWGHFPSSSIIFISLDIHLMYFFPYTFYSIAHLSIFHSLLGFRSFFFSSHYISYIWKYYAKEFFNRFWWCIPFVVTVEHHLSLLSFLCWITLASRIEFVNS